MNPSPATHCVLCGAEAVLAPRVHLKEMVPGEVPRDVALGVCETHGTRLRKGEVRVVSIVEGWLAAEGRFNLSNPLDRVRLLAHCLACDAPLEMSGRGSGTTAGGELIVECGSCPAINVVEQAGGDPVAVRLFQKPPRPRD
jgi:hypothetical protein